MCEKQVISALHFIYLFIRFYLFIFRERRREGEREGKKHQCVVASHMPPTRDLAWKPGMCPRLGFEPAALWFAGWHSIHWATPARAVSALHLKGSDFTALKKESLFIIKFITMSMSPLILWTTSHPTKIVEGWSGACVSTDIREST